MCPLAGSDRLTILLESASGNVTVCMSSKNLAYAYAGMPVLFSLPDLPLLLVNDCSAADTAQPVPFRPSRINLGVNARASKHSDRGADALACEIVRLFKRSPLNPKLVQAQRTQGRSFQ